MNTSFIITGGAGRVACSIPALEKYHRLNPYDDFNIIVHAWESLFWSHPLLQSRTYQAMQKGNFEQLIRHTRVVIPEPYQVHGFYNQRMNLIQAFDEQINNTDDHSDLNMNYLHLSDIELAASFEMLDKFKTEQKKKKVILFQPFGSSVRMINQVPMDQSNRSLTSNNSFRLISEMNKYALVLNASPPNFRHSQDTYSMFFDDPNANYFRRLMAFVYHCDYFVGCDSVGQHIARAFNKPGLVIMGATDEINYSYPEHFTVYRKPDRSPAYSPWRLSDVDVEFADRMNSGIMDFNQKEISDILGIIRKDVIGVPESAPLVPSALRSSINYN